MTVSIVIPTQGVSDRFHRCLDALGRQTQSPVEVIMVTPDVNHVSHVVGQRPHLKVVPYVGLFSFCRAVNLGIAASSGEWILLLNDDVVLTESFIEGLLAGIPADDRIGMVCGKLLAADDRTIDSTGQFLSRARTARERGHRAIDVGQFDQPGYVFSAPGAAALYRRAMLEALASPTATFGRGRVEYFDERLAMYLEDLELGWRAQRAGWRAFYVSAAVAVHARGATAKSHRPRRTWLKRYYLPWLTPKRQARYVLNRYRLIAKHDAFPKLLRDSPWMLWYELKLWAYLLCVEPKTVRLIGRTFRRANRRPARPQQERVALFE